MKITKKYIHQIKIGVIRNMNGESASGRKEGKKGRHSLGRKVLPDLSF